MRKVKYFFYFILLFLISSGKVFAEENNRFITIINPVRIAPYTTNSSESIKAEYSEIKNKNLPATWLLSFDVLNNKDSVNSIKEFDKNQELGILMEISSHSARAASVSYNQTDSWHRSNSVFLTGYSQKDREKLIDIIFQKFNREFGYFPLSVGAWWIDSYSLKYMADKYGVIANLNVSDQLGTDGYTLQGTYYSSPYYPSNYNAAFPASSKENKLDLVTLRWASRDPLNGYRSPDDREVTRFSTQDYFTIGLDQNYFESLVRKYTENEFSQITIGLEGDFPKDVYTRDFRTQISIAEKLFLEGRIRFSTMSEFANAYRKKYPNYSPDLIIESADILVGHEKIFWYQNPNYRIGIIYDQKLQETEIVDFRSYFKDFYEPFYNSPSAQYDLNIIVPGLIDNRLNKNSFIKLKSGAFIGIEVRDGEKVLKFENGNLIFKEKGVDLGSLKYEFGGKIDRDFLRIEDGSITTSEKFLYTENGFLFREFSPKIPFAIRSRLPEVFIYIVLFILAILSSVLFTILYRLRKKYTLILLIIFIFGYLIYKLINPLYVSQSEIDALLVLKNLNDGRVLVFDKDCLRCKWTSKYKPAVMEGRRTYVSEFSNKEIVKSLDFVLSRNPDDAKKIISSMGIKYIYLAKYNNYIESLSFSPEDLGIRKIYENGNAVIYEVN